jgi:HK97 family phage portal protein
LYRAVQLRSYSVSSMPFQLMKGDKVYDDSSDWKNEVGFLPNPYTILQLVESALIMSGRAYLFRERNVAMTKALKYHLPTSVHPKIDDDKGMIEYFERPMKSGVIKRYPIKDYVYFWLPDPFVELGPAISYPAKSAFDACGILLNMDLFADNFFKRGAIKAMLLTVKGMPVEAEREKLKEWWYRVVSGIRNAFGSQVINADSITPVVVGEGMKELENVTIGQEKREDISIALGIPMSILFAGAANFATARQDEINFLTKTIVPDCQFIQSVLNEQLFDDLGLHWEFLPETLDALQTDEASRSTALSMITSAGVPLHVALAVLGFELTDEQWKEIEDAEKEKKARADQIANQTNQPKISKAEREKGQEEQTTADQQQTENQMMKADTTFKDELEKWRRKALNAMKKGKPANVDFASTVLPEPLCETIMTALGNAESEDDVKQIFDSNAMTTPKPEFSDGIMALANELKRANDLLERDE